MRAKLYVYFITKQWSIKFTHIGMRNFVIKAHIFFLKISALKSTLKDKV